MSVLFLAEEIGWRGYMLPRVQQLTSRRRAAVVTGFVHGCFHLPLILIATTYDEHGSRWLVAPIVVATITAGGVFYAYLWDRTGSVWPVAMAHGCRELHVRPRCRRCGRQLAGRPGLRRRRERHRDLRASWRSVGAVLLARAKVWRTDKPVRVTEDDRELEPVA